jgi:hypothetical protein
VESADTAPTGGSTAVFEELNKRLELQLTAWHEIQSKDLAAMNAAILKANIPAIAPAAEKEDKAGK